jgi:hypothetical protein
MKREFTEQQVIDALRRLRARWPRNLWLFAASGTLNVMRTDHNERRVTTDIGGMDPSASAASIKIPCDGGDW